MKRLREVEVADKPSSGLTDGGHIYIDCSNCNAALMDIWRSRPNESHTWKLRASCPFCGDKSFIVEVKGGFHPGGFGVTKEDDDSDDIPITSNDGCDIVNGVVEFRIVKANPDVKPVIRQGR